MESKTEMLDRHARELAELESRWWERDYTQDPTVNCEKYMNQGIKPHGLNAWIKDIFPCLIRKRKPIGLIAGRWADNSGYYIKTCNETVVTSPLIAEKLACRALAPGEKVEI